MSVYNTFTLSQVISKGIFLDPIDGDLTQLVRGSSSNVVNPTLSYRGGWVYRDLI